MNTVRFWKHRLRRVLQNLPVKYRQSYFRTAAPHWHLFSRWGVSTLCNPMDCSIPVFPVLHYLLEFAQTHVHHVCDTIQPSHPVLPLLLPPFPASGSIPMSQFLASSGQSIGALASASVLPMNIQSWFPLGQTGLISLQFKGPSRVFSNTTVRKHQFFSSQPFLWFNSHIHTWLLEKP